MAAMISRPAPPAMYKSVHRRASETSRPCTIEGLKSQGVSRGLRTKAAAPPGGTQSRKVVLAAPICAHTVRISPLRCKRERGDRYGATGPLMQLLTKYRQFEQACRSMAAKVTKTDDKKSLELLAGVWATLAAERLRKLENMPRARVGVCQDTEVSLSAT